MTYIPTVAQHPGSQLIDIQWIVYQMCLIQLESTKKMSMSISFMLLVSLLQSFCLCLASGAFVDFQLTTEDPNHLTLECFSAVTGDVDYGSTIEFFSTPSEDAQPLGNIVIESNSANIFDVTPSNEAFLRCTSSDGSVTSDFVAIAGKTLWGGPK